MLLPVLPIHCGKVRDSYAVSALGQPYRMVVVSNRISVYDFVLGFEVPYKGEVLSAMNVFMRLYLSKRLPDLSQDLVAYGGAIDRYLPAQWQGNRDLQKTATVVRSGIMIPVEVVVRGNLTGSGYDQYSQTGRICGHKLKEGLFNGVLLREPLYTPTTKAKVGHDEPLNYQEVDAEFGKALGERGIQVFKCIRDLAHANGLVYADSKFEFDKNLMLCDEVGTPDSSRYWDKEAYNQCYPEKLPPSLDKQFVRTWAQTHGVHDAKKYDPKNSEHRMAVRQLKPPPEVIKKTTEIYLSVFEKMTGMSLWQFQREILTVH